MINTSFDLLKYDPTSSQLISILEELVKIKAEKSLLQLIKGS